MFTYIQASVQLGVALPAVLYLCHEHIILFCVVMYLGINKKKVFMYSNCYLFPIVSFA